MQRGVPTRGTQSPSQIFIRYAAAIKGENMVAKTGKLTDLKPQENNANQHTERGLSMLERSIQEDGWISAITVAADGEAFDGSARLEKGVSAGFEEAIFVESDGSRPIVHIRTDIPNAQDPRARKLAIAANRVAEADLSWNPEVLYEMESDHLLDGLFTPKELDALLDSVRPDGRPEPGDGGDQFDPGSVMDSPSRARTGDLWAIGHHLVMCGDSTDRAAVDRLTGGNAFHLLATDPPYNLGIDYGADASDSLDAAEYAIWTESWFHLWEAYSERQIVTIGINNLTMWHRFTEPHWVAPWIKSNSMSHGIVSRFLTWEPILFIGIGWKRERSADHFNFPISEQRMMDGATLSDLHPCPKPLALWMDLLENYSEEGDTVADCFGGAGTTLIAAHRTGRRALLMEKSPRYCDVILSRALAEGIGPIERIAGPVPALRQE